MHAGGLVQANLLHRAVKGFLHASLIHRLGSASALTAIGTTAGKKPDWIAMAQPVRAQQREGLLWQWDRTVLIAFARANVQLHTGTINLGNLERHTFEQAQATAVDHAQTGTVVWQVDLSEELPDLLDAQHHGQLLWQVRADEVAERPGAHQRVGVEERDGIESDIDGVGREVFDIAQIEEILAHFLVGDQVRRLRVVESELLDRSEVGLLGTGS